MASTAVITVEGVLQKNVSYAPIPVGLVLYHALASNFNIALVSEGEKEEIDYWLNLEGLTTHGTVVYNDFTLSQLSIQARRLRQVNTLRSRGFAIDLVVEPDPIAASSLLGAGYTVLNFLHYAYALPQWRPDFEPQVKPWASLKREAEEAAALKSLDTRLNKKDEITI